MLINEVLLINKLSFCIVHYPLHTYSHSASSGGLKDFIYLFLDKGEGREKERERNINVWLPLVHAPLETQPTTQACALTGIPTGGPLVCRPVLH